jgi:uncharacterized membrane protein (DUF373 family)
VVMEVSESPESTPTRGHTHLPVPYTQVHSALRRTLETGQDLVVIALTALLTLIALQALWRLLQMTLWEHATSRDLISQIVYVLILTELYRTLIFYLREHRVSVSLMLEVAIVSILRGLILSGVRGQDWREVLVNSVLLVVLGGLLALERCLQRSGHEVSSNSVH